MDKKIKERIRELRREHGIPTAQKGVPLFQPGGNEPYVANIYASDDMRALGFRYAADKLVEVAASKPGYTDYFVYPVAYLYRMYIESRLKEIIQSATGRPLSRRLKVHNLLTLWAEAKPMMKRSSQCFDDQELEAVEEKLREFCKIDPDSDAFRYATNKNGKPTLRGMRTLDLKHLNKIVDSISTPLEGSSTAVYEDKKTG